MTRFWPSGWWRRRHYAITARCCYLKSPHKFSKTPPEIPGPAEDLGEHTGEILRSVCGYSDEKLRTLTESGLIVENHPA